MKMIMKYRTMIFKYKKVTLSPFIRGPPEGSLFNIYHTEV